LNLTFSCRDRSRVQGGVEVKPLVKYNVREGTHIVEGTHMQFSLCSHHHFVRWEYAVGRPQDRLDNESAFVHWKPFYTSGNETKAAPT
jgi:hypothetical protein